MTLAYFASTRCQRNYVKIATKNMIRMSLLIISYLKTERKNGRKNNEENLIFRLPSIVPINVL